MRRRLAETKGVEQVQKSAVKPLTEQVDFLRASRSDLIDLRYAHSFALDPARIPGLAQGPRAPRFAHETAFALRVPPGTEVRLDPTEHDAQRWVPIPEALELLPFAGLRRAIRMASSGGS